MTLRSFTCATAFEFMQPNMNIYDTLIIFGDLNYFAIIFSFRDMNTRLEFKEMLVFEKRCIAQCHGS
jgi:hypothetical protein